MITYKYFGGRLGENISFIYGLFKFCKNNHLDYDNIKIDINYKSKSLLKNKDGEYVFLDNYDMFQNIKYVFTEKKYFRGRDIVYIDLNNNSDIASFYDYYKYNPDHIGKDICFGNWWSLDKYWITKDFDFELLKYICFPQKIVNRLKKKYMKILNNSLCLHIRRGDFLSIIDKDILNDKSNENFKLHFSNKEIFTSDKIHKTIQENYSKFDNILIFSDDINWCEQNFGMYKHVSFIRNNYPYEDMLLMSLCTKIICNKGSYFSRIPYLINFYNNYEKQTI